MLVLARKTSQRIILAGGLIKIMVVEIRGDKVRIGIEAPDDVSIHREEVQQIVDAEQQERSDAQG